MSDLEKLPLWQSFSDKANDKQRQMVVDSVSRASVLLDLIRDTFPIYTLHTRVHALNVVKLMGELLGERINNITALEGAILLLSAFYHDIGMVYSEDERNGLSEEADFTKFLTEKPDAKLKLMKNDNKITSDFAEEYCRWAHANRVYSFLDDDKMKWGVTSLKTALGDVCSSHDWSPNDLNDNLKLPTDFNGDTADLRFCAIILRIADILDFDNSRTPEEIYKYLGIGRRNTPRKEISDIEWRKHLCSEGFSFPKERTKGYELFFVAQPDTPAVEHDLRQFVDTIETEMGKCENLIRYCNSRWHGFILPRSINRKDIKGKNYKYGEHRFTLDQDQVLDLLMGENLYEDPYVFVRELIQNSIDTTRYRLFYEENRVSEDYKPKIDISQWQDKDGYQWVQFDDNGMGMDEYKIINYLLKVGKSYYRSADFEIDKINHLKKPGKDFTPISRFGIGILSCFIVGDRVEISTRQIDDDNAIRLSLSGLHGFYTLQSEKDHHEPIPMSFKIGHVSKYRKEPGTTIQVRISPKKEDTQFNLKEILLKYVLFPPIDILCEDQRIEPKCDILDRSLSDTELDCQMDEDNSESVNNIEILPDRI